MYYRKDHFEKLYITKTSMQWHEMTTGQHKSEKNLTTHLHDELPSKDFRVHLGKEIFS